jgi:ABC-2 type transport system ATP-binding protein
VLARVDLSARAHDRYDTYSLGMKQRLGVAAALLKDPALLILDEPTNGLDPRGIAEMRALIRDVGRGGQAVLLSSHLLSEVEHICDRVGVLQRGRLIAEGTLAAQRGPGGLVIRAEPLPQAQQVVQALAGVQAAQAQDGALRVTVDPARAAEVNRRLVEAGLTVSELRPIRKSLEEVFFGLTERSGSARRGKR